MTYLFCIHLDILQ